MRESVRSHRVRASAIGAATVLAAALVPSAAAQAATTPAATVHVLGPLSAAGVVHHLSVSGRGTFTIVIPGHAAAGRSAAVRPQTLSCSVSALQPFEYYGGPYGGGEEAVASTTCSPSVYSLEVQVALTLNGSQVAYGSNTTYATVSTSANADYSLSPGDYVTEMDAIVVPAVGDAPEYSGIYETSAVYLP